MPPTPCVFRLDVGPYFWGFNLGTSWHGFGEVAVSSELMKEIVDYLTRIGSPDCATKLRMLRSARDGLIHLQRPWMITIVGGDVE